MKIKKEHLCLAIEQAYKSKFIFKHGAVALHKGKVISKAVNRATPERKMTKWGPASYHAEAIVCDRAHSLPIDTVISVRVSITKGNLTCALPCKNCQAIMKLRGVEVVIYSDYDGKMKRMRLV